MLAYIVRRLINMVIVIFLVSFLAFSTILLLGDPVTALVGKGEALDEEQMEHRRKELGLDKPIPVQYIAWLGKVLHGDLGKSTHTKRLVVDELRLRIPVTLELGIAAFLIGILIAIPTGIISATRRGSKLDLVGTVFAISGAAVPQFWLGIMLILLFGVVLGWLPTFGFESVLEEPIEGLRHLILPAFSLGAGMAAVNMRQTRSAMLEVLAQDYIRTARAKGQKERLVILVHAFKNALLPVITLMGLLIGRIVGGAVIIETMFSIPGVGGLLIYSIFSYDFPVTQACILLLAVGVCVANLVVDIAYGYFDPRIRYG
jgi:peptide/nickel transport system permease protein